MRAIKPELRDATSQIGFLSGAHRYHMAGRVVPSVTQLVRGASSAAPWFNTERARKARARGVEAHRLVSQTTITTWLHGLTCPLIDTLGHVPPTPAHVDPVVLGLWSAGLAFQQTVSDVVAVEWPVGCTAEAGGVDADATPYAVPRRLSYAGTPDAVLYTSESGNGRNPTIVEYKTGKPAPWHREQALAYALAWNTTVLRAGYGDLITDDALLVYLGRDGTYTSHHIDNLRDLTHPGTRLGAEFIVKLMVAARRWHDAERRT